MMKFSVLLFLIAMVAVPFGAHSEVLNPSDSVGVLLKARQLNTEVEATQLRLEKSQRGLRNSALISLGGVAVMAIDQNGSTDPFRDSPVMSEVGILGAVAFLSGLVGIEFIGARTLLIATNRNYRRNKLNAYLREHHLTKEADGSIHF